MESAIIFTAETAFQLTDPFRRKDVTHADKLRIAGAMAAGWELVLEENKGDNRRVRAIFRKAIALRKNVSLLEVPTREINYEAQRIKWVNGELNGRLPKGPSTVLTEAEKVVKEAGF